MTKEEIIDNIARLNSEIWKDREEVRTEIGKLLTELNKSLEQQPSEDCVSLKEVEKWLHQHVTISIPSVETQMFEQLEKELPRVTPTQSWIPISERLPRQEVEVLTCNEHGFIEIQSLEDGYWENQHGDCTDFDDNNVIAWQPLPQPYEEKRGSEDDSN